MADPRWHLRFANFKSALALLREAVAGLAAGRLSELEREGLIQRFEYAWELGWKTLRDFLKDGGVKVAVPIPANVIRAAFQNGLIDDGEAWMDAKAARNAMAHEYDRLRFEEVVVAIKDSYFPLLSKLEVKLNEQRDAGN